MDEGEEKKRKKKRGKKKGKKSCCGEGGVPQSWIVLLTVQWVEAVRCNQRLICGSVFEFFSVASVMKVIILARGSQSYPGVASTSQGGFGVMEVSLSASVP
jgi:hypothetical protein